MKLSAFKQKLNTIHSVNFELPNGEIVPPHFHITEVGQVTKKFIDCGGTVRNESKVNLQLLEANDLDHRLSPQKLMSIITLSEKMIGIEDQEVEVEYQTDTIGIYSVEVKNGNFVLVSKHTNCLASDKCGITKEEINANTTELIESKGCCTPGSGCC